MKCKTIYKDFWNGKKEKEFKESNSNKKKLRNNRKKVVMVSMQESVAELYLSLILRIFSLFFYFLRLFIDDDNAEEQNIYQTRVDDLSDDEDAIQEEK